MALKHQHDTIEWSGGDFASVDFSNRKPILTFMRGDQVGRIIPLAEDPITLGRSPGATILLNDGHVSRLHCRIHYERRFGTYHVTDLDSANGTIVNEERVSQAILKEGDKIILGGTVLCYSLLDRIEAEFQGEIHRLINIDELTGLVVKRRFDEELSLHIAVAHRDQSHLGMLMMDMDGVKLINDTHGHAFGAYSIQQTGHLIRSVVGQRGLASRFGGDEFMAFLPGLSMSDTLIVAENIRHTVDTHPFVKDGIPLHPTISVGVASMLPDESAEVLLQRADMALYRAKNMGKNRVSE